MLATSGWLAKDLEINGSTPRWRWRLDSIALSCCQASKFKEVTKDLALASSADLSGCSTKLHPLSGWPARSLTEST